MRLNLLAVEHGLTRAQLHRTSGPDEGPGDVDAWVEARLEQGIIVARPSSSKRSWDGAGPRLALAGDAAQATIRSLAREGDLDDVVDEGRRLFGARAMGEVTLALQRGDLIAFDRLLGHRKKRLAPVSAASWLRASVCDGFDAEWLERIYEHQTPTVVARVLSEALHGPAACEDLYRWAERHALEGTVVDLCQHAILRGNPAAVERLVARLPARAGAAFRAAASFSCGDLALAQEALDAATSAKGKAPDCGYVAPILAILLLERGTAAATSHARRFMSAPGSKSKGMAKAFRALVRHHERRECDASSLHVQQVPPEASAWRRLLTGFLAHFVVTRQATRGAWASALVQDARRWADRGYPWLGEQALSLAMTLQPERGAVEALCAQPSPSSLSLWDRLSPKPAWQKALAVLTDLSGNISREMETAYRVAWVVDVPSASLSRPLLQKLDPTGTWSVGQRVPIPELEAVASRLPDEDREVVRRLRGFGSELEALDALVGHARVFDGMRGMTPVVVVRGRCRVETRDTLGGIALAIEPEGAREGLHAVAEGEDRIAVYRVDAAFDRLARALPEGLFVPSEGESQLLEVLAKLSSGVEVSGPHLAEEEPVAADATPCVRMAVKAGAYVVQVGVRPFGARGRWLAAGRGVARLRLVAEGRRFWCERDLEAERIRGRSLLAACPSMTPVDEEDGLWSFDEVGLLGLLSELSRTDVPHTLEWRGAGGLSLAGQVSRQSLRGSLRCIKGWYLAEGTARLDADTEVSLAKLSELPALAEGRFLRIAPGAYVEVESHLLQSMATLRAAARRGGGLCLHGAALPSLEALIEGVLDVDEGSREWLERLEQGGSKQYRTPRGLTGTLRDYQREGYLWLRRMCELSIGACLADDMGLGKTVQIIALLLAHARRGPALVVSPTSVCSNWARELARFAPGLKVVDYAGRNREERLEPRKGVVVITSYAIMQQDIDALAEVEWEVAVIDEAQLIKNAATLRARAAYRLRARRRIAATGTPIENDVGDLWAIFRFLNPGLLGNWKAFRRRFVLAIERDGSVEARETLRGLIGAYVLRRTKQEVLPSLPPLTEVSVEVELGEAEAALHQMLQRDLRDKLQRGRGRGGQALEVLAAITKLRRFCCHPRLVYPDVDVGSSKVETLITLVEELRENGHRALVFSQFVGLLDLVRERLDECGVTYAYLDGSTPQAARQGRVDAFQRGDATLFVISLKAGGFGLNLTGADYVIHLDPWWNPAVESQATDRAHRIGQSRPVTVYRLITRGTIEEKIVARREAKRELADTILDPTETVELTTDELMELLARDPSDGT